MKQLPTEGKKFKVVDGLEPSCKCANVLVFLFFFGTIWCNVFANNQVFLHLLFLFSKILKRLLST